MTQIVSTHVIGAPPDPAATRPRTDVDSDAMYRKVMLNLLPMLLTVYIIAYIDRSNVGFAKLGFLKSLGFTETVFGIGAGLFYAGYMIFEIPSNLLMVRMGFRKTLSRVMLLWAICSALLAFMSSPLSYYVARFLLGASEAGLFPGVLLYLTYWVPVSRRTRFTAAFMAALPLSGVIGAPLSGLIMYGMDGLYGLKGWQWLFLVEGAPALLFAFVVLRVVSDRPETARWLTPRECEAIRRDLEADYVAAGRQADKSFTQALLSPRFLLLAGMGVALLGSASNISFWLPSIIQRSGVSSVWQIGVLGMAPYVCGVLAQQWVARRADLRNARRRHAVASAVLAAVGWAVMPWAAGHPMGSLLALSVIAAGTFAAMGPFWSLPSLYLGRKAAAGGIALISTMAGVGSLISPVLIGWLNESTGAMSAGQFYLSALLAVGAITVVASGRPPGGNR